MFLIAGLQTHSQQLVLVFQPHLSIVWSLTVSSQQWAAGLQDSTGKLSSFDHR